MNVRHLLGFLSFILLTLPVAAQVETGSEYEQPDTVYVDSVYTEPDSGYDDYQNQNYDYQEDNSGYSDQSYEDNYDYAYEEPFFSRRDGLFGGPTIEFTELKPHDLDPDLDGDLVLFGGQIYAVTKGWLIGGAWVGATLYDLSPKYDEFAFDYGGFLTGYDQQFLYKTFSLRPQLLIGGGGITQIKRRPDIVDTTGHVILERYRDESFFLLRPGASLGFLPLPFLEFRLSADYFYPIGGSEVADLRKLTYGLHIMVGFGQ